MNKQIEYAVFSPRTLGFTKEQVIDMIKVSVNERIELGEPGIKQLDESIEPWVLTDSRMQQFVDEWYGLLERCDFETACEQQELLLIELAKEIS